MPNDGTGNNWDETDPGNDDIATYGPQEIRDLRVGLRLRLKKEHDEPATSGVGGEHKAGSAKVYFQSAVPTTRPDGTTLSSADNGRIWIDADDGVCYRYTHPTWYSLFAPVNVINTAQLVDGSVTNVKLGADAVNGAKLADNAVNTEHLTNSSVTDAKIVSLSYAKLTSAPGSLPPSGGAGGALTGSFPNPTLAANSVATANIQDDAVTSAKIPTNAVDVTKINVGSKVVTGSYAGNGTTSNALPAVGFTIKSIMLYRNNGTGPLFTGFPGDTTAYTLAQDGSNVTSAWTISGGNVTITTVNTKLNAVGGTYYYHIFG